MSGRQLASYYRSKANSYYNAAQELEEFNGRRYQDLSEEEKGRIWRVEDLHDLPPGITIRNGVVSLEKLKEDGDDWIYAAEQVCNDD